MWHLRTRPCKKHGWVEVKEMQLEKIGGQEAAGFIYWIMSNVCVKGNRIHHPHLSHFDKFIILTFSTWKTANTGRGLLWTPLIYAKTDPQKGTQLSSIHSVKFHKQGKVDSCHRRLEVTPHLDRLCHKL